MVSFSTIIYIKVKAVINKEKTPKNIKSELNKYQKYTNYKLLFLGFDNILGASATIYKYIIIYSEWAYQLLVNKDMKTFNAFLLTLKHEEAHKEKNFTAPRFSSKSIKQFYGIVTEVHCDFRGAEIAFQSNRQQFVEALKYKIQLMDKMKKNSTNVEIVSFHPSWDKRIEYATNYNFNEKLIRTIASDINLTDEKIINIACHHFDEIILK